MSATAPRLALEARGVHKSFGERHVLRGVDLEVRRGETLVILGPSGGGKSTLLRCLVGLDRPDQGTVRILDVDLFRAPRREVAAVRERMGMAFQAGALFGSMTLSQNIDLPLSEYTRLPLSTRRIVARIKLGMVGLEDSMQRYPSQLSGGMKKRASLARAMALDPEILFFDEPSAGLDPVTGAGLDRLLLQMKEVFDVTLVVVTHELSSAFAIADRIAMMHDGRFLITGKPEEVRACSDTIVQRFLDRRPEEESEAHSHLEDFHA
jgi:phospholipid/cholesterol/gamma-HCH transport system ATP-binding protein